MVEFLGIEVLHYYLLFSKTTRGSSEKKVCYCYLFTDILIFGGKTFYYDNNIKTKLESNANTKDM
jgi:hypothetical protein